jgi:hypothetical protein
VDLFCRIAGDHPALIDRRLYYRSVRSHRADNALHIGDKDRIRRFSCTQQTRCRRVHEQFWLRPFRAHQPFPFAAPERTVALAAQLQSLHAFAAPAAHPQAGALARKGSCASVKIGGDFVPRLTVRLQRRLSIERCLSTRSQPELDFQLQRLR